MVFKPNYNMQRAERDRAKQARKEEKACDKEERRKADLAAGINPTDPPPATQTAVTQTTTDTENGPA